MAESKVIKSVWKVDNKDECPASLDDIMAEQFQEKIHQEDNNEQAEIQALIQNSMIYDNSIDSQDCLRDYELACMLSIEPDCSADFEFAEQLQRQLNREAELNEKFQRSKEECGVAKAVLSSDPYYFLRKEEESSEDEDDADGIREFATNLLYEKYNIEFPASGVVRTNDGVYVTKHDREINERKNFVKAMQMPIDFATEDMASGRLTDKVLNDLRICSKLENRKRICVKDKEEKATSVSSLDLQTRLIILKWINSGEIDRVEGDIAMGKEATVFHAISESCASTSTFQSSASSKATHNTTDSEAQSESSACCSIQPLNGNKLREGSVSFAIKVFRTTLAGFRNRSEYVKDDFRFKNPRRVMKIWAEKEFMNLQRLRRNKITCPTPILHRRHVLMMTLIGKDKAAPTLKEVQFLDSQSRMDAFKQVREIINRMFKDAKLVHGDLSEFNLLWHNDIIYVIDVAQAMDTSNSRALAFLLRDITNVLDFFRRIGTEDLPTESELFTEVTGIDIDPAENLSSEVDNFERENRSWDMRRNKSRPADMELRIYNAENADRSVSPARPFN